MRNNFIVWISNYIITTSKYVLKISESSFSKYYLKFRETEFQKLDQLFSKIFWFDQNILENTCFFFSSKNWRRFRDYKMHFKNSVSFSLYSFLLQKSNFSPQVQYIEETRRRMRIKETGQDAQVNASEKLDAN